MVTEHRGLEDQAVTVARLKDRIKELEQDVELRAEKRAETREAEAALVILFMALLEIVFTYFCKNTKARERTEERARQREAELRRRVERAEATCAELQRQHDEVQR